MNIVNSINIKKISIMNYRNKNVLSNVNKTITTKQNIKVLNKNLNNSKIQNLKKIDTSTKELDYVHLENNLININNFIVKDVNHINQNFLNVFALIGHNVLIPGTKISYIKNTNIVYGYFLSRHATSLLVQIKDPNHQLVFSHLTAQQNPGNYVYYWNGEINHVCNLSSGFYELSVQAANEAGPFHVQSLVHGIVKSIDQKPNSNEYKVNLGVMGTVDINDIKRIF